MNRTTRPESATATTTVTLDNPSSSSQPSRPTDNLILKLNRKKKKVSWQQGTVDNEFLQKKSSKKCCIFHKQKSFDEDESSDDDEDRDHDIDGSRSSKKHNHDAGGCCFDSDHGKGSTSSIH